VPRPSALLRLIDFAVPCLLALGGVQPLLGAAEGTVGPWWAVGLAAPAVVGAALVFIAGRLFDRGDLVQPPWYSAWALLPGAFLLAGATAMCIFGALVELAAIMPAMWALLAAGIVAWAVGLVVVRRASR
jgi:hypothetical protein